MRNPRVVPLHELHRRAIVPGDVVADVQIRADKFPERVAVFILCSRRTRVTVQCDHQLVFLGKLAHPPHVGINLGNLRRDRPRSEQLRHRETVIEFLGGHREDPVHLENLNAHAAFVIHAAKIFHAIHRRRFPPLADLRRVTIGRCTRLRGAGLSRHHNRGHPHEQLDRLRAQLDRTEVELATIFKNFVTSHRPPTKTVGHVQADVHSGDPGVRLAAAGGRPQGIQGRKHPGRRERGQGEFCKFTAGVGRHHDILGIERFGDSAEQRVRPAQQQ